MNLCVWDTLGSPLLTAAALQASHGVHTVPHEWGRSAVALHFGRGSSDARIDTVPPGSAVLLGPWLDMNPEALAGPLEPDMEYVLSERLALIGSAQRMLQDQTRVLNPLWLWTGSISIQDTGEQRRLLREAGFTLAPEIISNSADGLRRWGERLPQLQAEATIGQLSGVDGPFAGQAVLDQGVPFFPRRYLARRRRHALWVIVVLMGRTYAVSLAEGDTFSRRLLLAEDSELVSKARTLRGLLNTEVCEILIERTGRRMHALALARTVGMMTPLEQLPFMLGQLADDLAQEDAR